MGSPQSIWNKHKALKAGFKKNGRAGISNNGRVMGVMERVALAEQAVIRW
ncbi:hypothetical protein ACFW1P_14545 [Paenibacillus sp. NPDC058910]